MEHLTIRYDVPGMSPDGELLEEVVLRPTVAAGGIGFILDPAVTISQKGLDTVARAAGRGARALGIRTRSLTVRWGRQGNRRIQTGHDCSAAGDAVLDVPYDRQWAFNLWLSLIRSRDVLSGRFPSMHATARIGWIDAMWALSLEGQLAARGVVRRPGTRSTAAGAPSAEKHAKSELLTALVWSGKQRGLSLRRDDAERIAEIVWGKNTSLAELVALGEKYGFRREGPLASIPLPDLWPRNVTPKPAQKHREEHVTA